MRMAEQTRCTSIDFQTRDDGGRKIISGYFARFDDQYDMYGDGSLIERIDRHAFDKVLAAGKDVRFLYNHDSSNVLARTGSGSGRLWTDDIGLAGEIEINMDDSMARDVYARVLRGDVSQCSFGFFVRDERITRDQGKVIFTVLEADLMEVSIVAFPAYEKTGVKARRASQDIRSIKQSLMARLARN